MEVSSSPAAQAAGYTALKAAETQANAQMKILKSALEVQVNAISAILEILGVGAEIDIRA